MSVTTNYFSIKSIFYKILMIIIMMLAGNTAIARETHIDVRVLSQGAKFIGTSMGGVQIALHDVDTGELLVRGKTAGGTGDTDRIMKQNQPRDGVVATDTAARFRATLDLDEPRQIRVTARGPLAQRQAMNTASATRWVVPGKHVTGGNGWLLEMPGFVVDILDPPAHKRLRGTPVEVTVAANVTMMCGCPITPGGLWDADQYEVAALIRRNGEAIGEQALDYAGTSSGFAGTLRLKQTGSYEITVYAYDPATGNTGIDKTTFNVSPD